jgi:hypothetical protein
MTATTTKKVVGQRVRIVVVCRPPFVAVVVIRVWWACRHLVYRRRRGERFALERRSPSPSSPLRRCGDHFDFAHSPFRAHQSSTIAESCARYRLVSPLPLSLLLAHIRISPVP